MISALAEIKEKLDGRLNALINNAGISIKCDQGGRLNSFETEMSAWRQVFEINFFASVFLSRELKQELARASGAIVNVTSIAGSRVHPFAGAAYATSKAALAALTREMAHDFGPLGVRVNAIAPGPFPTWMLSTGVGGGGDLDINWSEVGNANPRGRVGTPEDIAGLAIFLCSRAGAYTVGETITCDGGAVASS